MWKGSGGGKYLDTSRSGGGRASSHSHSYGIMADADQGLDWKTLQAMPNP